MNQEELSRYRRHLLALRERLRDEIDRMAETVRTDARVEGEHDRAVSEAVDKEIELERTEEAIRRQVVEALTRIEDGTYGTCLECGAPIAPARLDVVPYTPYCIACERRHEQRASP